MVGAPGDMTKPFEALRRASMLSDERRRSRRVELEGGGRTERSVFGR
jgi:hypothetical protein